MPTANNLINFKISGPKEILTTDNGNPTSMVLLPSRDCMAFNEKALVNLRQEIP